MITILIFIIVWCCVLGQTDDAIRNMTQSEQALMTMIVIASELNFWVSLFKRKEGLNDTDE